MSRYGLCNDCERSVAARGGVHRETCDTCGAAGAYRNPDGRKNMYLCSACHIKGGSLPRDFNIIARTACSGLDVNDTRHIWKQMGKSRWRCTICKTAEVFKRPALVSYE